MATKDADAVFVDTNVLVYATQVDAPLHEVAGRRLSEFKERQAPLWISRQVLREYLATRSRPQALAAPLSAAVLQFNVQHFEQRFDIAEDSAAVTAELLDLIQKVEVGGKQMHDANIVATMRVHHISRLLTHNVRDFARFAEFITVLPLQETEPT
jgi:predicted nucleic acid-binding protein